MTFVLGHIITSNCEAVLKAVALLGGKVGLGGEAPAHQGRSA
jgi:hypothetical protein